MGLTSLHEGLGRSLSAIVFLAKESGHSESSEDREKAGNGEREAETAISVGTAEVA